MSIAIISGGTVNLDVVDLGNIVTGSSISSFEKTEVKKYNSTFINNFHYNSEFISYNINVPTVLFGNDEISGTFSRNNCSVGYSGSSVTYTVAANRFTSINKENANLLAQATLDIEGQIFVNNNGTCNEIIVEPVYWNNVKSNIFTKNNCENNYNGTSVTYTVAAHTYSGTTQEIADNLAINDVNTNGQAYANTNGTCTQSVFWNSTQSNVFIKNDCENTTLYSGTSVTYTIAAHTYSGATQEIANNLAINDVNTNGQAYANTNGTCIQYRYGNIEMTRTFTSNNGICPSGFAYDTGKGDVTYILHENVYLGNTQEAADQLAISIIDDPNGPAINYARSQRCNHV